MDLRKEAKWGVPQKEAPKAARQLASKRALNSRQLAATVKVTAGKSLPARASGRGGGRAGWLGREGEEGISISIS